MYVYDTVLYPGTVYNGICGLHVIIWRAKRHFLYIWTEIGYSEWVLWGGRVTPPPPFSHPTVLPITVSKLWPRSELHRTVWATPNSWATPHLWARPYELDRTLMSYGTIFSSAPLPRDIFLRENIEFLMHDFQLWLFSSCSGTLNRPNSSS
jgi:hypothetical protein